MATPRARGRSFVLLNRTDTHVTRGVPVPLGGERSFRCLPLHCSGLLLDRARRPNNLTRYADAIHATKRSIRVNFRARHALLSQMLTAELLKRSGLKRCNCGLRARACDAMCLSDREWMVMGIVLGVVYGFDGCMALSEGLWLFWLIRFRIERLTI